MQLKKNNGAKNSLDGLNSRVELTENIVSELVERSKFTQFFKLNLLNLMNRKNITETKK